MAKHSTINVQDIKMDGNFDTILESLYTKLSEIEKECKDSNKYSKRLSKFIKLIVVELGLLDEDYLEDILNNKVWNKEQAIHTNLHCHILVIKANSIAQFYLNNITVTPEQEVEFLNNHIHSRPDVFDDLTITL